MIPRNEFFLVIPCLISINLAPIHQSKLSFVAVYRLRGKVQNYAWGGTEFLPALLQTENPQQEPWAEYWLGIHPKGPAIIETENGPQPLDE